MSTALTRAHERFLSTARYYQHRYFPDTTGRMQKVAIGDASWLLRPKSNLTERLMWMKRSYPEPESVSRLVRLVRGRRVQFLDIGANCGVYSVTMGRAAAPGSRLVAFEPNPAMAERLRGNLGLNGLPTEVVECALGAEVGEAQLSVAGNAGQSSLAGARHTVSTITVPVRPLTDFVHPGWPETVVKIDVEGYEAEVLLPFFEAAPPSAWPTHLLLEVEHATEWSGDVLSAMHQAGYSESFAAEGNALFSR